MDTSYHTPLAAGIDVAKDQLDLAFWPSDAVPQGKRSVPNTDAGRRELVTLLRRLAVTRIVLEASGGYERPLMLALSQAGLPVVVINPKYIRHYAWAVGIKAKSDPIDASVLARYGSHEQPELRAIQSEPELEESEMVTRRRQLVATRQAEACRLEQSTSPIIRQQIKRMLQTLDQQIEHMEHQINQRLEARPTTQAAAKVLRSVKGVGEVLSHTLLTQLPELGRASRSRITSLVGLAPFDHDSGKLKGKRCISGGRGEIRSVLYMCMLSAIQHNHVIRDHYHHLLDCGKLPMVALTACMRKLLLHLNSLMRTFYRQQEAALASTDQPAT